MHRFDPSAKGVYLITVTPFTDAGALDLASTDRMVDFCIERGVTGLTILGIMGEATKLTAEEAKAFTRQVVQRVGGRVPIVVGVSSPGFAAMGELTKAVMDLGASGVMVAPPSTVRTDDQIAGYFDMVNETLGPVPWCLQDHPVATGVQMSPSVILRILKSSPGCVMLKHEDWPGLAKLSTIRAAGDEGKVRARVHPDRQRRRPFPPRGAVARRRRCDDGVRLARDDGRRGCRACPRRHRARP